MVSTATYRFTQPSIGNYCTIAPDVQIGDNVTIGNNVTIYPRVTLGDNVRIMDNAVIGRLSHLTPIVTRRGVPPDYEPLTIGAGSVIGCGCVLYTGSTIGENVLLADQVNIREGCTIGDFVQFGRQVTVNYDVTIGARTRIMDLTHITGQVSIGASVFIGMLVSISHDNDIYLRRLGINTHSEQLAAPRIEDYAVIAHGVCINPGVTIGRGAMAATGAVIIRDLPDFQIWAGVPAKYLRDIPTEWREAVYEHVGVFA